VKNGNRVKTNLGGCTGSLVRVRSGSIPTRSELMVGRGGTVDSSQRWYGELGTVERVGPGSAAIDQMVYAASFGISEGTWGL
jgi:hypothetical protein